MARTSKTPTNVFVALLRGVNVGGNNMVSMRSLKASFETLGFADVRTYINSGNILFRTKERDARKLERKIEAMLAKEYGLETRVVVRSSSEIADLVENWPRNWDADKNWRYNVMFLRHSIDSERVMDEIEPKPEIERVIYRRGALLWSARTRDLTRTSMVKLASRKIYKDMTIRNNNTAKKIYELMKEMSEA